MRPEFRGSWRILCRMAAVVLLMFAWADLAFPQYCAEDGGGAEMASAAADEDGLPERPGPEQEDCFCCCSHVVASQWAPVTRPVQNVDASPVSPLPAVLSSPARGLDRPPRLV